MVDININIAANIARVAGGDLGHLNQPSIIMTKALVAAGMCLSL